MNILAPVKSIMTTELITVNPEDKLLAVKEIFEKHKIHHLPVVRYRTMVGLISKTDFLHFLRGFQHTPEDALVNEARLRAYTAESIMTKGLAKVLPDDRINVALMVFLENRFHALPVVNEENELVGIITTFDIIKQLESDKITPQDILDNQRAK